MPLRPARLGAIAIVLVTAASLVAAIHPFIRLRALEPYVDIFAMLGWAMAVWFAASATRSWLAPVLLATGAGLLFASAYFARPHGPMQGGSSIWTWLAPDLLEWLALPFLLAAGFMAWRARRR